MKVIRNNNINSATATATATRSFLTHIKRVTLVFLIMASLILAIANISFANAQRIEFIVQFGTPEEASMTVARDVFADSSSGNVYVVGSTSGTLPDQTSEGDLDAFIIKYDSNGEEIWTRQFGTEGEDSAQGVSVDSSGGVYVVGHTTGTLPDQTREGEGGEEDAFIIKYDSNGEEIWTRQFGTSGADFVTGVSADSSGVYVVGWTVGTFPDQTNEGDLDAFIIKYDSNGEEIWTRQFGTPQLDTASGVSVDSSDGVYVAGDTEGTLPGETSEGDLDAFIIKYNSDGEEIWTRQFGTSENLDGAMAVSADSSDVYVVGFTQGTLPDQTREGEEGEEDAFIIKYNSDGEEIWTRQFGTSEFDTARGVSVDSSGGVYVAGDTFGAFSGETNEGEDDTFVRKYNSDGEEIWTRQFGSSDSDTADGGVSVDSSSGVYVSGFTEGTLPDQTSLGNIDAFLAKLVDEDISDDDERKKHHDEPKKKDDDKRRKH
jgi:hypothetical protein